MTLRPIRAYRAINRDLTRLRADDRVAQEEARLELTRRASIFSRRSRQVVDNTMQLSAILLRAGEVEEANRLLVEADQRVEDERNALMESVVEVKAKVEVHRQKMTRLRLAKMLVSAVLGAGLMVFSAFGIALASYLAPDVDAAPGSSEAAAPDPIVNYRAERDDLRLREIQVAPGFTLALTRSQWAEFKELTARGADGSELEAFLRGVLPGNLADQVAALTGAIQQQLAAEEGVAEFADRVKKAQSETAASQDAGTDAKAEARAEKRKASNQGDGGTDDDGTSGTDESCEDKGDGSEAGTYMPGDCIPIVNKESPI
jgi:hypothetical protein